MSALGIALLSIGLLVLGGGIGFFLARLGRSADSAKLEEVETELDDYRRQVTDHFSQTAEQFHAIGQQYKDLYEHLATGSEALCQLDSAAESPFPRVGRDDKAAAADTPDESMPTEEVLLAAAAVTTAAVEVDFEAPVDLTVEAPESEAEAVADESAGDPVDEEVDKSVDANQADLEADDTAPDNVIELMPRGDSDEDDGGDSEQSAR